LRCIIVYLEDMKICLKGFIMEANKNDIDLVITSKSDDDKVSSDARMTLWNKYQFFIQKKYFQWLNTFSREHVEFEDFIQEAYIAFSHALDLCDVDRMREKNVNNFSTVLYFQLIKIKNKYDMHYEKYGHVYTYSEIGSDIESSPENQFSGSNTLAGQWIAATTIDAETEQRRHMYESLLSEYESSLGSIERKIFHLILEKKKVSNIISSFSSDLTEQVIKKKISDIRLGFRSFVEQNAYV